MDAGLRHDGKVEDVQAVVSFVPAFGGKKAAEICQELGFFRFANWVQLLSFLVEKGVSPAT